jgi:hypothetical protein
MVRAGEVVHGKAEQPLQVRAWQERRLLLRRIPDDLRVRMVQVHGSLDGVVGCDACSRVAIEWDNEQERRVLVREQATP